MTYRPRQYQAEAVTAALWNFDSYGKPFCLVLPTGSGKSIVIAEICHRLDEPILILQPTKEILEQNYEKLLSYGVKDIGVYSASMKSKEIGKFTYATIGSIYRKPEEFMHFKHAIIDEAHLVNPRNLTGMYNTFFKAVGCTKICGLTATPFRLVQKYFKEGDQLFYTAYLATINRIHPFFFKKFAYDVPIETLLKAGFLCRLEYKQYSEFDVSNIPINTTGADYDADALEQFWSDTRLEKLAKIIGEVDAKCNHNLIFCSSIRQATRCVEMLQMMGFSADYVTSQHSPKDRDRLIADFRSGKIKHMANVGVLTTGFDFPALDSIVLARPTISLALLYQMAGRGMRPFPGKQRCQVVDITNNITKLGRIETIRLAKETGGFRSIVRTEVGEVTNKPLFKFAVKDEEKKQAILGEEMVEANAGE